MATSPMRLTAGSTSTGSSCSRAPAWCRPPTYLPAATGGPVQPWHKVAAVVVIAMLLTVTGLGVCLTYGPSELFDLLQLS